MLLSKLKAVKPERARCSGDRKLSIEDRFGSGAAGAGASVSGVSGAAALAKSKAWRCENKNGHMD